MGGAGAGNNGFSDKLFEECLVRLEEERLNISEDLGLDPSEVDFWFENRRTPSKIQTEETSDDYTLKAEITCDNDALKAENEKLKRELEAIMEKAPKSVPSGRNRTSVVSSQLVAVHPLGKTGL